MITALLICICFVIENLSWDKYVSGTDKHHRFLFLLPLVILLHIFAYATDYFLVAYAILCLCYRTCKKKEISFLRFFDTIFIALYLKQCCKLIIPHYCSSFFVILTVTIFHVFLDRYNQKKNTLLSLFQQEKIIITFLIGTMIIYSFQYQKITPSFLTVYLILYLLFLAYIDACKDASILHHQQSERILRMNQEIIEMNREKIKNIFLIKHDYLHNTKELKTFLQEEKYEQLNNKIQEMLLLDQKYGLQVYCGNMYLNAFLTYQKQTYPEFNISYSILLDNESEELSVDLCLLIHAISEELIKIQTKKANIWLERNKDMILCKVSYDSTNIPVFSSNATVSTILNIYSGILSEDKGTVSIILNSKKV